MQRAIAQEKVLIKNIQLRTPLVETYIQDTKPDLKLYSVPVDEPIHASRVDFGKVFFDKSYEPKEQAKKRSFSRVRCPPSRGCREYSGWRSSPTIRTGSCR